jgi:hypothetical protein
MFKLCEHSVQNSPRICVIEMIWLFWKFFQISSTKIPNADYFLMNRLFTAALCLRNPNVLVVMDTSGGYSRPKNKPFNVHFVRMTQPGWMSSIWYRNFLNNTIVQCIFESNVERTTSCYALSLAQIDFKEVFSNFKDYNMLVLVSPWKRFWTASFLLRHS